MRLEHCFNYRDFRELARRHLPSPIFNYIDGAADDAAGLLVEKAVVEGWLRPRQAAPRLALVCE